MSAIYLLVALGLVVAGGFLLVFIWSVRKGQYDDDYTPAVRILFDDETTGDKTERRSSAKVSKQNQSV